MADVTRKIGLSLGADICWPACYEEIISRLNLNLAIGGDNIQFAIDRVTVEPFNLRQPCNYDVVLDRLTHWFYTSREWIKKAVLMDGLYVLNNPWAVQATEKSTTYAAMMKLGLAIPETWLLPPKEPTDHPDNEYMIQKYGKMFDLNELGEKLGYPLFMKPYDGGGWVGVSQVKNPEDLLRCYNESGGRVMHIQEAVNPYDLFVRAIGIGPEVAIARYNPEAPLHGRYEVDYFFLDDDEYSEMEDMTLTINGFFGWDFNSCEALRKNGKLYPIDFANACPDFQVTSLHYYFPILVKMMIRWSLFCAATRKPMRKNLDWEPYFDIMRKDLPFRERLAGYADITRERMKHNEFRDFCDKHLSHLDEVLLDFFQSARAREIVHEKVSALYPPHEIESFTSHFWGMIQYWCKTEEDRLNKSNPKRKNRKGGTTQ